MDMTRTATTAAATLAFGTALALAGAAQVLAEDLAPPPPDLDCSDISERNIDVSEGDPHNLDGDGDGVGCEEGDGSGPALSEGPFSDPPPDLDCPDISERNIDVSEGDPHNFDADGDGVGCEEGVDFESDDSAEDDTSDEDTTDDGDDASDDADSATEEEQNGDDETPVGGVDTGAGGTADGSNVWLVSTGGVLVAVAASGLVLTRKPRRDG
ncbi:hypothetical protein [Nocardiopsis aegyptia]|uniref:Excalibur calcium-binding domain-containing protein n=1 Tax=Nocardiopsis aegyptia TaxID=220378 RepID=A0A7Z0JCY0_9ACTN|nr:hypothetical protein [Nocardiopsis aegyptia]NYJ37741.1 hypothetical protein [Nocardiopsis aegyptia]